MKPYKMNTVKIFLSETELLKLETWCASSNGREVSGVGTVEYKDGKFLVTKVWLLSGGSSVYTQIEPKDLVAIFQEGVDPSKIKLWWHRHPVGDGRPGPQNWSGTDENTIQNEPLGSSPSLVQWSLSIVRTPAGWVGRIDDYRKDHTLHCGVSQPFSPEEFSLDEKTMAATHTPTSELLPPRKRDAGFGKSVGRWLAKIKRPGKNDRDGFKQKSHLDYLREIGMDNDVFREIGYSIWQDNELPEDIAEDYGYDIFTLRELNLITDEEVNYALDRIEWVDTNRPIFGRVKLEDVPDDLIDKAIDNNWVEEDTDIQRKLWGGDLG